MPLSEERKAELAKMTPEQLLMRKKQLQSQKGGGIFKSALMGGLQGLSGQKITGLQPEKTLADEDITQQINIVDPDTGETKTITSPTGRVIVGERDTLAKGEKRRQISEFGGIFKPEQISEMEETTNMDFDSLIESGRATRLKDGRIKLMDRSSYSRMIEEGKFAPEEQKHIRTIAEEINSWARIVRRMNELGVKEGEQPFEVQFEKTTDPFLRELGIFSIPARFEVARQFKDDPRLAAVARDIELAFQKFRTRVTGAQASDKEIQRLRIIIAKLTDQPAVFFETIRNFMENTKEDYDILLSTKERFGRDTKQFEGLLEELPSVSKVGIEKTQNNIQGNDDPLGLR